MLQRDGLAAFTPCSVYTGFAVNAHGAPPILVALAALLKLTGTFATMN